MNRNGKLIALFIFSAFAVSAQGYELEDVPNVKLTCASCFVTNPDAILSSHTVEALNRQLSQLESQVGVEVAVVVVKSIGYNDYTDFAYRLFNHWGIGKKGSNTGLLILFVFDERAVKIETGYGLEGLLPDGVCSQILNETMFPLFKKGDYDGGFLAGINRIVSILTSDKASAELLLNQHSDRVRYGNLLSNYLIVGFLLLIILAWRAFYVFNWQPTAANNVRYTHVKGICTLALLLGIAFPLPILLFYIFLWIKRRNIRRKSFACTHCHNVMHLLTEKEEDAYLKREQLKEEELKSVDYDVWLCGACAHTEVLPYVNMNSKYGICSACRAKTYYLKQHVITQQATTFRTGQGCRIYVCANCGKRDEKIYVIPKTPPVVVVGAGGRSSGGGFSGGSWGGGSSGGGGAGGRF
ncbi:MAG: TPM domain-containing protein [Prevotellaceae bacterium]|jgi:uncharacterized protein|nr:TPM domain-containing protein [Prevotellaceae bacterium]